MRILFKYLKPHQGLVFLTLLLATINVGFSLIDPILFGKLVNLAGDFYQKKGTPEAMESNYFFWVYHEIQREGKPYLEIGIYWIVIFSISVAMISRISKNFQD